MTDIPKCKLCEQFVHVTPTQGRPQSEDEWYCTNDICELYHIDQGPRTSQPGYQSRDFYHSGKVLITQCGRTSQGEEDIPSVCKRLPSLLNEVAVCWDKSKSPDTDYDIVICYQNGYNINAQVVRATDEHFNRIVAQSETTKSSTNVDHNHQIRQIANAIKKKSKRFPRPTRQQYILVVDIGIDCLSLWFELARVTESRKSAMRRWCMQRGWQNIIILGHKKYWQI